MGKKKKKVKFLFKVVLCAVIIALLTGLLLFVLGRASGNIPASKPNGGSDVVNNDTNKNPNQDGDTAVKVDHRDPYSVVTKYCDLSYPEEWDSLFRTEIVEGDVYTVDFYGLVEGKEDQLLFSVVFGDSNNVFGYLTTDEGKVSVGLNVSEFFPSDDWTASEADLIYGMQEEVNYVLEKLQMNENFERK